jgi:hypothetical protein
VVPPTSVVCCGTAAPSPDLVPVSVMLPSLLPSQTVGDTAN